MWKVVLEKEYLKMEFNFEDMEDASCFIETAISANRSIRAIITLEYENKDGEE